MAAHTAVHRYDALALEYARTYGQLERLLLNRGAAGVDARQAQKADDDVVAAEGAISIQNDARMSRNIAVAGTEEHGPGPSANRQPV